MVASNVLDQKPENGGNGFLDERVSKRSQEGGSFGETKTQRMRTISSYFSTAPTPKSPKLSDATDTHTLGSVKKEEESGSDFELLEYKASKLREACPLLRAELSLIPNGWFKLLYPEMSKPYFIEIAKQVKKEREIAKVYPPAELVYSFLNDDYRSVKVVIVGQDPYHGPNQAHGQCFSVQKGVPPPPSLLNIFKEIENDIGVSFKRPNHGCLTGWRDQGVLLLNDILTVREKSPKSHALIGWSKFTDAIVENLAKSVPCLVFMLWGSGAQSKCKNLMKLSTAFQTPHLILKSKHPSPLSANQGGWFGNKHFSQANKYLEENNRNKIDWGHLP